MWTARDIMNTTPVVATVDMKLEDASRLFEQEGVEVAPVVDSAKKIHGFLTSKLLVKMMIFANSDEAKNRLAHYLELLYPANKVDVKDDVKLVMKSLMDSPSGMLIVSGPEKKLTGVIGYREMFSFFRDDREKQPSLRDQVKNLQVELKTYREENQSIKGQLERLQRIVDTAPYMMHSVDEDGNIVLANKLLHRVLGYKDGELLQKTIYDIYPQSVHKMASQGLKEIKKTGYHEMIRSSMVNKSGELIRVELMSSAFVSAEGEFLGTITVSREQEVEKMMTYLKSCLNVA